MSKCTVCHGSKKVEVPDYEGGYWMDCPSCKSKKQPRMKSLHLPIYPKADIVKHPEHYSRSDGFVRLLLLFRKSSFADKERIKVGFYIPGLDEWRIEGSPSDWSSEVLAYAPMPSDKEFQAGSPSSKRKVK